MNTTAPTRTRNDSDLLDEIGTVMRAIQDGPASGIAAMLAALEATSRDMNVDLCEFSKQLAPAFLPYYYLLEGSEACDDPSLPLWVREDVRATRYSN